MKKEIFDELSVEDLQTRLTEERSRLQKLRFSNSITPLPNSNEIKGVKKTVARMLTAITQKQQA
jgi:large subunit ribosomal protein L29